MSFPDIDFTLEGYSWQVSPNVVRTEFSSKNTRQRKMFENRNDIFSARHIITDNELLTFEAYVNDTLNNGAGTDTFTYYTSDVSQTGTARIVKGEYNSSLLFAGRWEVTYNFELDNRSLSQEESIYNFVNAQGTIDLSDWLDALENLVNNNNL